MRIRPLLASFAPPSCPGCFPTANAPPETGKQEAAVDALFADHAVPGSPEGHGKVSQMQITSSRTRHVQLDRVADNPRKN